MSAVPKYFISVGLPPSGLSAGRAVLVPRPPRRARSLLASAFRPQLLLGLGALLMLLLGGPAAAGPMAPDDGCLTDSECQGHYNQALKLFEEGRFETALPEFQAAYQRRQMPWLLINIGRTLHRLGRSHEALEHYERYKQAETKPDPETQERLEKYIAQARVLTADTQAAAVAPVPAAEVPPTKSGEGQSKPLYKKWWFWTAIGGGVVLIVVIGAAAGAASSSHSSGLPSDVPKVSFTF